MDSKEVLKKLKENWFLEKSQKGSHKKLIKETLIVVVPVPWEKGYTIRYYQKYRETKRNKTSLSLFTCNYSKFISRRKNEIYCSYPSRR